MMNECKTVRRLHEYLAHLFGFFRQMRASAITTEKIRAYIAQRQEAGAANGTVNRELGILRRMFRLAHQQTPPKVARIRYIPMLEERNIRWGQATRPMRKAKLRGLANVASVFMLNLIGYNLVRIPKLLGETE